MRMDSSAVNSLPLAKMNRRCRRREGGGGKLTFGAMALPAEVNLRRPPGKPGPGHERLP